MSCIRKTASFMSHVRLALKERELSPFSLDISGIRISGSPESDEKFRVLHKMVSELVSQTGTVEMERIGTLVHTLVGLARHGISRAGIDAKKTLELFGAPQDNRDTTSSSVGLNLPNHEIVNITQEEYQTQMDEAYKSVFEGMGAAVHSLSGAKEKTRVEPNLPTGTKVFYRACHAQYGIQRR